MQKVAINDIIHQPKFMLVIFGVKRFPHRKKKKTVETQPGTAIFVVEILFKKTTCELIPSDTLKAGASPLMSWVGDGRFQENYNPGTPGHRTPQAIPLANYERNPIIACW